MKHKLEYGLIATAMALLISLAELELGQDVGKLLSAVGARLNQISPRP